jgi:bifunctional non-homologous end joining protein LigD
MAPARGSLSEYKRKRDFQKTAEPEGEVAPRRGRRKAGLVFVVQKHAASHLHFDLRLEVGGVMRSWAVPKGPSSDPADKRLAVQVEDHPMGYNDFEGTIPKGEYGGGTVMLWDRGTYSADDLPHGEDPEEFIASELERGKLSFTFHGDRLKGSYALVRTRGKGGGKPQWILLKHRDEQAAEGRDIAGEYDTSVVSGRTMDDIAAGRGGGRTWHSNRTKQDDVPTAPPAEAPPVKLPRKVLEAFEPMKASGATEPPEGPGWTFEPKLDGIRVVAIAGPGAGVLLLTRNGNNKSRQFPEVAGEIAEFAEEVGGIVVLDGELVGTHNGEIVRFESLQKRMHLTRTTEIQALAASEPAAFVAFDLLLHDGEPLLGEPWEERRARLEFLLAEAQTDLLRLGESSPDAAGVIARARRGGWEGVIAKKTSSTYESGRRSRSWLKIKLENEQEFVIGGWTEPSGSRVLMGSIMVGYYDGDGNFCYAGNVGSGFTNAVLKELHAKLKRHERKTPPFANPPKAPGQHWTAPKLVAQVRFNEWTSVGILRQPVFLGLRDDKDPREVVRETVNLEVAEALEEEAPASRAPRSRARKREEGAGPEEIVRRISELQKGKAEGSVPVEGHILSVTNLKKPFFKRPTRTKGDLLRYYATMSPYILPAMAERPLVLKRFPDGAGGQAFYQQTPDDANAPEGVRIETVRLEGKPYRRLVGGNLMTLLYTIQLGAISYDPWHGPWDDPDTVNYTVVDLDPGPGASFKRVVEVARAVREEMDALGLHGGLKTSGSRGIHIYLPLPEGTPAQAGQLLAELVATRVAEKHPKIATVVRMTKNRPHGTIYVDYLQNIPGKTVAGVYAVRATPTATVSTPLSWDELEGDLSPKDFHITNVPARVKEVGDLWAEAMRKPNDMEAFLQSIRKR